MRLLIADDDLTSRTILSAMTEEWGYSPVTAEDGQEAWDILCKEEFSLLLLDWEMPRMHGLDLCKRIREMGSENPPYIIMLTAHDHTEDIVSGLEAGANDYIAKPYNPMELKARLNVGKRMITLQHELNEAKDRLELLATKDELTQIHNRRSFNERYSVEWRRAMRQGERISVAIIDIDFFKRFNDSYGHLPGDVCLKAVAKALNSVFMRPMDFLARYGGEEFAVVLPNTSDPFLVLEECRLAVENIQMEHRESPHEFVTVSIGGATITPKQDHFSKEYLLDMADKELYKAKESGRNTSLYIDLDA